MPLRQRLPEEHTSQDFYLVLSFFEPSGQVRGLPVPAAQYLYFGHSYWVAVDAPRRQ